MAKALISGKTETFRVYNDGTDLLGTAEFTLPDVERLSDTIKGAGIMGEMEFTSLMIKAMTAKIKFNSTNGTTYELMQPGKKDLECRSVVNGFDPSKSEFSQTGHKYRLRGECKKASGGKVATAEKMDPEYEISLNYFKATIDGKEVLEIDVLNFIYKVNGTDYLADMREMLGMN